MTKDVLKYLQPNAVIPIDMETTIMLVNALKERLAQPEQEPVAWEQFHDPKRVQDMLQDVSTMGSAWSRGGERIDPMSVYKGFEPEAMPENNGGKPTAWYDPSNGVVSTDRDCPLFTPLGQVWPLYPKREWVGLTDEERIIMSRYDLEYAALIGEVERKLKEKNT